MPYFFAVTYSREADWFTLIVKVRNALDNVEGRRQIIHAAMKDNSSVKEIEDSNEKDFERAQSRKII